MIQLLSFLSDIDNAQSINEAFPHPKKKIKAFFPFKDENVPLSVFSFVGMIGLVVYIGLGARLEDA